MVESTRTIGDKSTVKKRYYISSLKNTSAKNILEHSRNHWQVENKHHWCMDVTFGKDKACIREHVLAQNIAAARRSAMNVLRKHPDFKGNLALAQRSAAFDLDFRAKLINSIT